MLSKRCVVSFMICMVGEFVMMSLSGLQSWMCICVNGMYVAGGMNLVSLDCGVVKLV